ncbi:MAG: carboxylesterase family protein [Bryobacteraceae bacterium]
MRFVAALILCTPFSLFAIDDPVRIANGSLSGTSGHSPEVRVYKGIPYAAPPVGSLRWKTPKAPAAWEGVRKADAFSPSCMQTTYPASSIYRSEPEPVSEDCLYLNVWTAAKSATERRPVMVWIHGGALTRGSGSVGIYDGEALAEKGVVVITINYRLGVFGFLAHPELTRESDRNASGNYGLLDQIAALEWVRKNVAAFGGDPNRVTIFGESAGSWSVNYLMATPLANGLFHRAIGESGGVFESVRTLAEAEATGVKFAKSMGADNIAALRAKPAEEILKSSGFLSFPPNVDGWMLPQDVYTIFATGKQNDVPILIGSNADEAKSLTMWPSSGATKTFIGQIKARFGSESDALLKLYPANTDEEAKASFYQSFTDYLFTWEMRTWARMENKTGKNKAYLYYFTRVPPGPESDKLGAFHASEIPYAFDNVGVSKWRPYEYMDYKLADVMSSYWVNFAEAGDPNGKGLPEWPVYQTASNLALELGDHIRPMTAPHKEQLDALDKYFAEQREKRSDAGRTGQ